MVPFGAHFRAETMRRAPGFAALATLDAFPSNGRPRLADTLRHVHGPVILRRQADY